MISALQEGLRLIGHRYPALTSLFSGLFWLSVVVGVVCAQFDPNQIKNPKLAAVVRWGRRIGAFALRMRGVPLPLDDAKPGTGGNSSDGGTSGGGSSGSFEG